ncbi:uncharacterized protein [Triticum aestivum]|uniref:uncharacterized protein n=1 Tax=Triticum aestivum TaxID=4565 RepID=UPI001D01A627|nr:uncharacterized protein LOC123157338 [Triticum aestivum]XP_044431533.1 uncharacterized protein LOC123157338 [Triticum aestivum]XP_044431534.1 uncharacterized protein LOC123157338 [Triticum aestivum]XP_044431535.1 uncharacterized protein LOC123157338 [Triticum aestivum]XP_044431536.1 uncharacterized protein LOC123157338 [Triticum aestivum]
MQRDCHVFFYFGLVHSLIYPVVFRRTNINVHVVMDGYVDRIVMSCKLHAEQIYIFVGEKFTTGPHTYRVGRISSRTCKYPKYSPTTCRLRWSSTVQNTISSTYLLTWLLTGASTRTLTASLTATSSYLPDYARNQGLFCKIATNKRAPVHNRSLSPPIPFLHHHHQRHRHGSLRLLLHGHGFLGTPHHNNDDHRLLLNLPDVLGVRGDGHVTTAGGEQHGELPPSVASSRKVELGLLLLKRRHKKPPRSTSAPTCGVRRTRRASGRTWRGWPRPAGALRRRGDSVNCIISSSAASMTHPHTAP